MNKKKLWIWNILAVLAVIFSIMAFAAHSKNWISKDGTDMKILSGIYFKSLKYSELDSIKLVERIPPMKRLSGFSAMDMGKGVYREFKDSLTDKKAYVFVDNFSSQKIAVTYQDSLKLYLNFKDSLETEAMYEFLTDRISNAVK